MSDEFKDIDKTNYQTYKIIVPILYVVVIVLFVFLWLGLKKQKDVIQKNTNSNTEKVEENIVEEIELSDLPDELEEENYDDSNLEE